MTVDLATTDTSTQVDPAVIANADASVTADAPLSEDAAMDAAWAKFHPEERVERENGRFVSPDPEKRAAAEAAAQTPLEGGEGEGQVDPSTVATDVPLPANWQGLDEVWAKVPPDARAAIAEHQIAQHKTLSDMGRKVAAYEPLNEVAAEFAEYFNGNLRDADGQPMHPADGVRYLANIQRQMDANPVETLLSIMDTYQARDKIAAALGVKAGDGTAPATDTTTALLAKIDRLEAAIRATNDPSKIEQVIDRRETQRQHEEEVSRLTSSKPLYSEIPEHRMVFFINEAWQTLGQDATKQQVFDHAYNAAVEASPTLRVKSQAATLAATDTAAKAEAAKRGTSVNVTSTAQAKPRVKSEDEAMEEVWSKHHKG